MELKKIFETLRKNWKIITSFMMVVFVLIIGASLLNPKKYEVNFSLLISQTKTQETKEFKYDTYYALEAKDKIGDWLIAFLKSPESVSAILASANFDNSDFKVYDFRNFFKPYKASSQSVGAIFYLKDSTKTSEIANSLVRIANRELNKTYAPSAQDVQFEIKATNPLVSAKENKVILTALIGLVFSFGLAIVYMLFRQYLTK
jgi:uncharacterized protein involved in exopolysaccharide biosynthesis